jgi:hypothetical protein
MYHHCCHLSSAWERIGKSKRLNGQERRMLSQYLNRVSTAFHARKGRTLAHASRWVQEVHLARSSLPKSALRTPPLITESRVIKYHVSQARGLIMVLSRPYPWTFLFVTAEARRTFS